MSFESMDLQNMLVLTEKQRLKYVKELSARRKAISKTSSQHIFFELTPEEEQKMSSTQAGDALWKAFLEKVEEHEGQVLFASLMGSRRYNLQVEQSDLDLVVVVMHPLDKIVGCGQAPETFKNADNLRPDYSVHSIEHYLKLLVEGDSKSLELLFSNPMLIKRTGTFWQKLESLKHHFLTKKTILNYLAEVDGSKGTKKLEKLMEEAAAAHESQKESKELKYQQWNKCAYIVLRCLILASRLLDDSNNPGSSSPIWFHDDSEDRKLLLDVRNGKLEPKLVNNRIADLIESIRKRLVVSNLRDQVSKDVLDEVQLAYHQLRQKCCSLDLSHQTFDMPPELQIVAPTSLRGKILFATKRVFDNGKIELFGIFARNLKDKLSLFGIKNNEDLTITNAIKTKQKKPNAGKKQPKHHAKCETVEIEPRAETDLDTTPLITYNFYELDRFYDAMLRSELNTIISSVWMPENVIVLDPTWNAIIENPSAVFTNGLLYQSCGYLAGRFKDYIKNPISLLDQIDGILDQNFVQKMRFALDLLRSGKDNFSEDTNNLYEPKEIESRKVLLSEVSELLLLLEQISSIIDQLTQNNEKAQMIDMESITKDLIQLASKYVRMFVCLRAQLSQLFPKELDQCFMEPWFLSCRYSGYPSIQNE